MLFTEGNNKAGAALRDESEDHHTSKMNVDENPREQFNL